MERASAFASETMTLPHSRMEFGNPEARSALKILPAMIGIPSSPMYRARAVPGGFMKWM